MDEIHISAANYLQVLARHKQLHPDIQSWLDIVPELVEKYKWEVSIAFVFMQIESMFHRALHRGLVKMHKTDSVLTQKLLDSENLTRARHHELFKTVFGKALPDAILRQLKDAEKCRNRAIHGKKISEAEARTCLMAAFKFIDDYNRFVESMAKFRPCADGRGFKGAGKSLGKDTSRWVLRGMGIPSRSDKNAADEAENT